MTCEKYAKISHLKSLNNKGAVYLKHAIVYAL